MSLVQDGLRQSETKVNKEIHEVAVTLSAVQKKGAAGMHEALLMFDRVHARLADVETQLNAKPPHKFFNRSKLPPQVKYIADPLVPDRTCEQANHLAAREQSASHTNMQRYA